VVAIRDATCKSDAEPRRWPVGKVSYLACRSRSDQPADRPPARRIGAQRMQARREHLRGARIP